MTVNICSNIYVLLYAEKLSLFYIIVGKIDLVAVCHEHHETGRKILKNVTLHLLRIKSENYLHFFYYDFSESNDVKILSKKRILSMRNRKLLLNNRISAQKRKIY